MIKNELQELARRRGFNPPAYSHVVHDPAHIPRFKASVNINGEIFDSPRYYTTLRHAHYAAAEAAMSSLCSRGPFTAPDDTGASKNLLQETAQRAGFSLPIYTTVQSGPPHVPMFTCTVEVARTNFFGEAATTKKQAEKSAAVAALSDLREDPNLLVNGTSGSSKGRSTQVGLGSSDTTGDELGSQVHAEWGRPKRKRKRPSRYALSVLVV